MVSKLAFLWEVEFFAYISDADLTPFERKLN